MKNISIFIFCFLCTLIEAQVMATFQSIHKQPTVQFDYWIYSTHAGNGSQTQYPTVPTNVTEMNAIFNTANSNTTLFRTGTTNSARILDWQSISELNAIGITLPNSGNFFALRIQGTFIPLETGTYTFTLSSDDASDLFFEGNPVITTYTGQAVPALGTRTGTINLTAGKAYSFFVRMQQGGGGFGLRLYWRSPSQNNAPTFYTSILPANTYFQSWTQNLQEMVSEVIGDLDSTKSVVKDIKKELANEKDIVRKQSSGKQFEFQPITLPTSDDN